MTFEIQTPNKLVMYKSKIRPIWAYGLLLYSVIWGSAKPPNTQMFQKFQFICLR